MKHLPFEEVAKLFNPLIKSKLRGLRVTGELYDQYYQAGLIGLWKAWRDFDETRGSFPAYAQQKITGGMMDEMRKMIRNKKREQLMEPQDYDSIIPLKVYDEVPIFEKEAIAFYLSKLSTLEQRWVIEKICNQKREAEIASEYGVTVGAVKSWRKRVVKKLRHLT
ncbi:sigma-70 family RNA polymerase sigma factor [Fictibacillus iocasae]|uniref:Sigma-70 family RNA polymerase sigma factor n=1 Tax=Fictibacillus iocasae TaxID=2715437 RepID=A0ABW2NP54_9BACL